MKTPGTRRLAGVIALALALVLPEPAWAQESPRLSQERVIFHTTLGDLVFALYPEVAPRHVAQVLRLARLGVFDTTRIHRVEPRFLVQFSTAQDRLVPLTRPQAEAIEKIPGEFGAGVRHRRGVLSMARFEKDPNSAETSFSILLSDAPHLDGKYTVFGQLIQGWDVLQAIRDVERLGTEPARRLTVEWARVMDASELGAFSLARAVPAAREPLAGPQQSLAALGPLGALVLVGLLLFAFAGRVSPQRLGSLGLVLTLVSGFVMLIQLTPMAQRDSRVAVLAFWGLIGLFKLMNQFEKPQA